MRKRKPFNSMDRRQFIKVSAAVTAAMSMPACGQATRSDRWGQILPTRRLGKTGLDPTIFTIGGGPFDSIYDNTEGIIEAAIKGGCRFFETARAYGSGESERQFGKYLTPNYRDDIILLSKTKARDGEAAKQELDTSLKLMKTDYVDIYLIHNLVSSEDIDERLKGGVLDMLVRQKEEGKIRHIGFSGHRDPDALNYLINKGFDELEVMLVALNVADPVQNSFILKTLPLAQEQDIGVMAMKVFAGGGFHGSTINWGEHRGEKLPEVIPEIISTREAIHFALSMPVSTITIGCNHVDQVNENIACVRDYNKLTQEQYEELVERVTEIALNQPVEHYKIGI